MIFDMTIRQIYLGVKKNLVEGGIFLIIKKIYFYKVLSYLYNFEIPYDLYYNANIHFCHNGHGIIMNPATKIGDGTYIQHDVTFGVRDDRMSLKAPVVGRNCYIGAKAIIIGGVVIGDNCKIGAGSVVTKNIPPNSTVVGIPARIIRMNGKRV